MMAIISFMRDWLRVDGLDVKVGNPVTVLHSSDCFNHSTLNPEPSTLNPQQTPRPGRIKGGESTQTIGASFWLQRLLLRVALDSRATSVKERMPWLGDPRRKRSHEPFGHSVGRNLICTDHSENARAWAGQAENPPKPLWAFGWIAVRLFPRRLLLCSESNDYAIHWLPTRFFLAWQA